MKPEHYRDLENRIAAYLADRPQIFNNYVTRNIPRADRVKDINKRFRWDMLSAVMPAREICDTLYPYLNDAHIDTALRAILTDWRITEE